MSETGEIKKKSVRATRQFQIDFISPMQLEECIYRFEHELPVDQMRVNLQRNPAQTDEIQFIATLRRDERTVVGLSGTMRRWQGTATRIQAVAQVMMSKNILHRSLWIIWSLVSGVLFVVATLSAFAWLESPGSNIMLTLCFWYGGCVVVVALIYSFLGQFSHRLVRRELIALLRALLGDKRKLN